MAQIKYSKQTKHMAKIKISKVIENVYCKAYLSPFALRDLQFLNGQQMLLWQQYLGTITL